jgi:streptogramin lyase
MELVEGVPITRYCDEQRLTPRQRLELFVPVCQGVQHAHQKGIIHRDLKPSNVLVALYDGKPVPKVIDFGVAKAAAQPLTEKTLVTGFGAIIGTLEYMAPEQIRGGELDARTDVYALGGVAFATITGEPPFGQVEGDVAKLYAHLNDPPPRASDRVPGLSPAIDVVLQRAMAKKPDERYPSAGEFARALEPVAVDEATQPETAETEQVTEPATVATGAGSPGRRRALGALAGIAVVAIAVGAVALLGGGDEGDDGGSSGGGGGDALDATIGAPIDIGDFTLGVATREGTVFVVDRGANRLGVVDEETEEVSPKRVGADPESVFAGEPIVWVVGADGSISRFDLADGRLTPNATRTIPLGGALQDVAVANQAAWVTDKAGSVTRIDPSTGAVGVEIGVGRDPYGVGVEPPPGDPDLIFVINRGSSDVSVIDRVDIGNLEAGGVIDTVPVGKRPKAVVVSDGIAWITNTDDGTVSRIDSTGEPPFKASTVRNVCEQPRDIAAGFDAIWVSCGEGAVARIDPESDAVAALDLGSDLGSPEGIAVGDRSVWVAMGDAGTVVPITPGE